MYTLMIFHQDFVYTHSFYTYIGFVTLADLSIPAFEVGLSLQFLLHHRIGRSLFELTKVADSAYVALLVCILIAQRGVFWGTDTRVNSLKNSSYVCAVPSINAWSRARKFKSISNQDRILRSL